MSTTDLFQEEFAKLNPAQRRAVEAIEGPVMVIAGPGTGKTQVLALRVANILRKKTDYSPGNILCISYTDAAAKAMNMRLEKMLGVPGRGVTTTTYHGFATSVIKRYPDLFPRFRDDRLLDELERIKLWRELIDTMPAAGALNPLGDPYGAIGAVKKAVQDLKREEVTPTTFSALIETIAEFVRELSEHSENFFSAMPRRGEIGAIMEEYRASLVPLRKQHPSCAYQFNVLERIVHVAGATDDARKFFREKIRSFFSSLRSTLPRQREVVELYTRYQQVLVERGLYDYDDMIIETLSLLQKPEGADVLADVRERYQYILVDEFQDSNRSQMDLLFAICSYEAPNVFVVGDDDQSIYRFQGASSENLLEFRKNYGLSLNEIIVLEGNYRSTQKILDAASDVIRNNTTRFVGMVPGITKDLRQERGGEGELIEILVGKEKDDSRARVARRVKELIATGGVEPKDIAIIYRNNYDGEELKKWFDAEELSYDIPRGNDALAQEELLPFLDAIDVITTASDPLSLLRLLLDENSGAGAEDVLTLFRFLGEQETMSVGEVIARFAKEEELKSIGVKNPAPVISLMNILLQVKESAGAPVETLDLLAREGKFLERWERSDTKEKILAAYNVLRRSAEESVKRNPGTSFRAFATDLSLRREHGIALAMEAEEKNAITFHTAHGAKGLEYDYVFIHEVIDGDRKWGQAVPSFAASKDSGFSLPQGMIIPSTVSPMTDIALEESRRLFYVALTRARKHAVITTTHNDERRRKILPSLFLGEILPEHKHVEPIQENAERVTPAAEPGTAFDAAIAKFIRSLPRGWWNDYELTYSDYAEYATCPRQFFYSKFLGFPGAVEEQLIFGSVVHKALERVLKFKENVTNEKLSEEFSAGLAMYGLTEERRTALQELGEMVLYSLLERKPQLFLSERLIEKTLRASVGGVPLKGRFDCAVLDTNNKTARIYDFKSGSGRALKPDHEEQVYFYKLLADQKPLEHAQMHFVVAGGEVLYLQKNLIDGEHVDGDVDFTKKRFADLPGELRSAYEGITSNRFEKINHGSTCSQCQFEGLCWGK